MYIIRNEKNNSLTGFILLILGLIIFNNPFGTLKVFLTALAFLILFWGIANLVGYRYVNAFKIKQPWLLTQGIINVLFASAVLLSLNLAVSIIMLMIGCYIIGIGVLKIFQGFRLKKYNIVNWERTIVMGVLGIAAGILLLVIPEIVPMFLGSILIISGIIYIINSLK